ncbi:MAG: 3-hydroxy-3-methylglutaryl CoA synthase [Ilumatobacteraceae bacterium]|nr:3-hydroxy-3-methylglutaryl CoA synthase [Ilumatobacteraceae bacterium]
MTGTTSGILGWGTHLPYRRLDRSTIAAIAGTGGGKGTRSVASFDEDATTMGVEAARGALATSGISPSTVWFSTVAIPYLDKTNATTLHAALRLDTEVGAYDVLGSVKSAVGAIRVGLSGNGPALVVTSDLRGGLPGSGDESNGGDGAAALVLGSAADGTLLAELIGRGVATEEFLDRWRTPGDNRSKLWEERPGETRYAALATLAWKAALGDAGLEAQNIDHLVVTGTHDRANASVARSLGAPSAAVVDSLAASIGNTGAASPALLLASALEQSAPDQVIALVVLADGVEVFLFRTTAAIAGYAPRRTVAEQVAAGGSITYGKYLGWRGHLSIDPPRRPEPVRPSATASSRSRDWKFGFVGSVDDAGEIHLPPAQIDHERRAMAEVIGTIVTYTIDKLSYSLNPPVVFAVVDFDGGGRLPIELTDVDAAEVEIGGRVEMTFRKLFTADGVHNYFWKARPIRGEQAPTSEEAG